MSRGKFVIAAGQLRSFHSYILLVLKQEKIQVKHQQATDGEMQVEAYRGNQLVYFVVEQLASFIPLSDLFGWAVRVQVSLKSTSSDAEGNHVVELTCEAASNEVNPIAAKMEEFEERGMMEAAGEDNRCREVFATLSHRIMKSKYAIG